MPDRTHLLPWRRHARRASIAALVALLAAVFVVFVLFGPGDSELGRRALALEIEAEAPTTARPVIATLDAFEAPAPSAVSVMDDPAPTVPRKARATAKVPAEATLIIGFTVLEEAQSQPLNAYRASVSFALEHGEARWTGRKVERGDWFVARRAFGHERLDSRTGADKFLYIKLDPATPRGVPLAFEVELAMNADTGTPEPRHRGTFRGEGTLTLSGAPHQWLPDVLCRPIGAWAEGVIVAGPHVDLGDARVELVEMATAFVDLSASLGGELLAGATRQTDAAAASAPVLVDRTFSVPAPSRPTHPNMNLRVVLADGRTYEQHVFEAFKSDIVLRIEASRTAEGRLLFRGASATGLARIHAEQGGAHVGQVILERDGAFTIHGAPFGALDVVIESGRPGGELARFPLAAFAGETVAGTLDLGVIEVEGHATVLELELVDRYGMPAAAQLRWRGRGGSGSVGLRAEALHTLLLPPIVPYDMELVAPSQGAPISLAARAGRVRIVVGG